jgi:phage/plasmid-associated DNA primase
MTTKVYKVVSTHLKNIQNRMKKTQPLYKENYEILNKRIKELGANKQQKNICNCLKDNHIIDDEIHTKLDTNLNLIAFKDYLFDLELKTFRKIKKDDYISKTVGYKYKEVNPIIRNDLMKKIYSMFMTDNKDIEGKETADYVLLSLGWALFGNKLEKCNIFVGAGANGKSLLLTTLDSKALGDYYIAQFNDFLTSNKLGDAPNPALCASVGCRHLVVSEPNNKDQKRNEKIPFNISFLKTITGNDIITTRNLYKHKLISFVPSFTPFVCANDIPAIKVCDNSLPRRLNVTKFKMTFTENPDTDNKTHKKMDYDIKKLFQTEEYARQYLLVLIDLVLENKDIKNFKVPNVVQKTTQEYFESNNIIKQFIEQWIVKSDNPNEYIKSGDLKSIFFTKFGESKCDKDFLKEMAFNNCPASDKLYCGYKVFKGIRVLSDEEQKQKLEHELEDD